MRSITDAVFHDEEMARAFLVKQRWPVGVVCPYCNSGERVTLLEAPSMGPGWYHCNACAQ